MIALAANQIEGAMMRNTTPAPATTKPTAQVTVDVPAVTKRILAKMDARRDEIAKLLRAVQAALA